MQLSNSAETLSTFVGKRIAAAASSLSAFAIEFDDGNGLLLEASGTQDDPEIVVSAMPQAALPRLSEAVCTVDWGWISNSTVETAQFSRQRIQLRLNSAGPLNVSVGMWQGKPFLTFMPYRAAK